MSLSTHDITEVLQRVHLFGLLKPEQLFQVAALCEVRDYGTGEIVYSRGDVPHSFYIVCSGEICITARLDSRDTEHTVLARLHTDDCFGELVAKRRRVQQSNATTTCPIVLLEISKSNFLQLVRKYPSVAAGTRALLRSWKLLLLHRYRKRLPGVAEVVNMSTPHWLWLARRALVPTMLTGLAFLWTVFTTVRHLAVWPPLVAGVIGISWLVVLLLDWRDDKHVVTSKRVISENRLVLVHSTRSEAPLHQVRAVQVSQGSLDRVFGCGDVVIQAFAGKVVFHKVPDPHAVREIILESVRRARVAKKRFDMEARQQALHEGMGWQEALPLTEHSTPRHQPSSLGIGGRISIMLKRLFPRFRERHGDTIMWRKHPLVLARTIGLLLGCEIFLVMIIIRIWTGRSSLAIEGGSSTLWFGLLLMTALFVLAWAWYRMEDWRNDTYTITLDRLIDSERKPLFGRLTQRTAPIESVLNVSYDRLGIFANLFNYGTVTIQTGGDAGELTFDWVLDPFSVQQEILLRVEQSSQQREDVEAARRSTEIVEWLRSYSDVTKGQKPDA